MSASQEQLPRPPSSIAVGVLATVTMDAALVLAGRLGGEAFTCDKLAPEIIGRWAGALCRGKWRHDDIVAEPKTHGELAMGLATHYVTGFSLTSAYFGLVRLARVRPGPLKATAFGAATALLPFLILYPSWGYGWFGRRSDDAVKMTRIMILGHTAFGAGIGVWTEVLSRRAPVD